MTPNPKLQKIIQQEIPITTSMGIKYEDFKDSSCLISVPLAPNHNHKGTAFGGSLYSACAAACYGLLYHLQVKENLTNYDLLLASGEIAYSKPVQSDFKVLATLEENDWQHFQTKLKKQSFGKIKIKAKVFTTKDQETLCNFTGQFVLK